MAAVEYVSGIDYFIGDCVTNQWLYPAYLASSIPNGIWLHAIVSDANNLSSIERDPYGTPVIPTLLGSWNYSGMYYWIHYIKNPAVGASAFVRVQFSSAGGRCMGNSFYKNVDQATPFGTIATAQGTSQKMIVIPSGIGLDDLGLGFFGYNNTGGQWPYVRNGDTQRFHEDNDVCDGAWMLMAEDSLEKGSAQIGFYVTSGAKPWLGIGFALRNVGSLSAGTKVTGVKLG